MLAKPHVWPPVLPNVITRRVPALSFDGVDDLVTVPDAPSLKLQKFTIEVAVQFDGLDYSGGSGSRYSLMSKGGEHDDFWFVYDNRSNNNRIWAQVGDGTANFHTLTVAQTLQNGQTYHLAYTYNSFEPVVLLEGVEIGRASIAVTVNNSTSPLLLGSGPGDSWLPGVLLEARLWSVARTPQQIRNDMHRRLTGLETGLAGYWRMDEGSGLTVFDATPNGNDGQITGATWRRVRLP